MRKTNRWKNSFCLAAAALMLASCGQGGSQETTAVDTAAVESIEEETTAEETQKETAKEEETTQKSSEEETGETKESGNEAEKSRKETEESGKETEKSEEKEESTAAETKKDQTEADQAPETTEAPAVPETPAPTQAAGKSAQDIYNEITQSVALNSPMVLSDSFIANYYGIDVSTLDEYVFSMSEMATSAETVVILKAKDGGNTGALSAALQTVIDQKKTEMENYLPDQYQIVDKSSVQVSGNYVYLVISEQAGAISKIIQSGIQ